MEVIRLKALHVLEAFIGGKSRPENNLSAGYSEFLRHTIRIC